MAAEDFDLEAFGSSILNAVDSIRSTGGLESLKQIESRIHAFYRAIGLPAFVEIDTNKEDINKYNNGNIFVSEKLEESVFKALTAREGAFSAQIKQDEIDDFLDNNQNTIIQSVGRGADGRKRGSLFPMAVNGEMLIYPQKNRVAGAFILKDSDITVSGITYRRPFIETVVLTRLKAQGVQNDEMIQKIKDDFGKDNALFKDVTFTASSALLLVRLSDIIDSLRNTIKKTLQMLGDNRSQIRKNLQVQISNIPDSNAKELGIETLGETEEKLTNQQNALAYKEAVTILFEFDDSIKKETNMTKNMRDSMLSSQFLNLMTTDGDIEREMKNTQQEIDTRTQSLKQTCRALDLILGTFSGLSAIDVLVVVCSLFILPEKNLLGLLNDDAIERLKAIKGDKIAEDRAGVMDSITALENTTENIMQVISDKIQWNTIFDNEDSGE